MSARETIPAEPPRRWYRPTPERCIVVLLLVECLLWLSEQFRWLPFNHHKGWTVLIATGIVGAAIALMLLWYILALIFRWRFQFSIRSMLVLTVAVAVVCSWLATDIQSARKQREATVALIALGDVQYDWMFDSNGEVLPNAQLDAPGFLRKALGDDFFFEVHSVLLGGSIDFNVSDLRLLRGIPQIRVLDVGQTCITDADVHEIVALRHLEELHLDAFSITSAGSRQVYCLHQLKKLSLRCTKTDDSGLEGIDGLLQLRGLELGETYISDSGMKKLEKLTHLESLDVYRTGVTDKGLECLAGLKQLQNLCLSGTTTTDAGLKHLAGLGRLETLHLRGTMTSNAGLECLTKMAALKYLDLRNTRVTADGVRRLQQLLPACHIETVDDGYDW